MIIFARTTSAYSMWTNLRQVPRAYVAAAIIVLMLTGAVLFASRIEFVHLALSIEPCRIYTSMSAREECIYSAIEKELKSKTTGDAMKMFVYALPMLRDDPTGCHNLAHRVGDIAYFNLYIFDPGSVRFSFPPESMVCDYGMYHGFYEHFFQEHPTLKMVTDTCSALPTGPEAYKRVIRQTCFHGAGHGLVLARVDQLSRNYWGDVHAFADAPLATCAKLTGLSPDEFYRCPLGVFAEIAQWRLLSNYGFSFDEPADQRFALCLGFKDVIREQCISTNAIVATLKFKASGTVASCTALKRPTDFASCVQGVILGQFVDGATDEIMHTALAICEDPAVSSRGGREACYFMAEWGLNAYYRESDHARLCQTFPEPYRSKGCMYVGEGANIIF